MSNKIKVQIQAELRDQRGRLIKHPRWKWANSLLKAFIQVLASHMNGSSFSIKDTGGTDRASGYNNNSLLVGAAAGTTTSGIVVGTGTNAVVMTDWKLQTQVTANVAHGVCSASVENPDAATWRVVITRTFTNNTGALLSISEVAFYIRDTATNWIYCADRTLYNVSVGNGASVTLTYRITITL